MFIVVGGRVVLRVVAIHTIYDTLALSVFLFLDFLKHMIICQIGFQTNKIEDH